ncbi:hypothetical protein [Methanocella sp. MCL-LM]|uniref:hypothetical protein n=1 Tax=Methanocella sp. MCL-LM TaxID=3412035 RepID=UPI003C74EA45
MVYCEHCGRTDGCSYQEFQGVTLCFRCYRAARDRAFEAGESPGAVNADTIALRKAQSQKSQIRRLADRFFKKE